MESNNKARSEMRASRKRLAIVCSPLGFNGGTFRHLMSWCCNFDRNRFEVALFCNFINKDDQKLAEPHFSKIPNLEYHPITFIFPVKNLVSGGWLSFAKQLRKFSPDIVHSVFLQADIICAALKPLIGFPILVSSWEGCLAMKKLHSQTTINIYKALMIPAKFMINRFVSISSATASQNCKDFGIPCEKVEVIHSGLSNADFPFAPAVNTRKIGLISRFTPEKCIDLFIRAIPEVLRLHPDYSFVVAGDGSEREHLEALAVELGIHDKISFPGWCADVVALLNQLEIFVFTSSSEGLPWSILEAMATGRPVIASAVGGVPDIVKDGSNGLLVKSADPADFARLINQLIENPGLKQSLVSNAAETIESSFTVFHEISAIEKVYENLLPQEK